jgi:hypothetical protein
MMSTSATEDDGEVAAMFASYKATASDRSRVVSASSPESIREFLGRESTWPAGRYEISGSGALLDFTHGPWGVAVKHPDGSVELLPDQA